MNPQPRLFRRQTQWLRGELVRRYGSVEVIEDQAGVLLLSVTDQGMSLVFGVTLDDRGSEGNDGGGA